jgi:hypothetical protein
VEGESPIGRVERSDSVSHKKLKTNPAHTHTCFFERELKKEFNKLISLLFYIHG